MNNTADIPALTPNMVDHFKAFGPIDLHPVRITRDVKSRAGNLMISKGSVTWANFITDEYGSPDYVSVWTPDHYAGIKSSSVSLKAIKKIDIAA